MSAESLYEILGVERTATHEEIRAAARRAASKAHPDREGGSNERMAKVNEASAVLLDPERRALYDATGSANKPPPIQEQARQALMQMFAEALENDGVNIVDEVRRKISQAKSEGASQKMLLEQRRKKLLKRRDKVKSKAGENLVHMLIDQQVEGINSNLALIEHALELLKHVEAALAAYTCDEDTEDQRLRQARDMMTMVNEAFGAGLGREFGGGLGGGFGGGFGRGFRRPGW